MTTASEQEREDRAHADLLRMRDAQRDRVHAALLRMRDAHEALCRAQQEALDAVSAYDRLKDHAHAGGPRPGDCVRCGLVLQLAGPAQGVPK